MCDTVPLHQAFEHHHATAVMMLARSKIERRPHDPYYGYRDLARYVHEGITQPINQKDVYLRLLAACKAERTPLPTLGHMQALMSTVWDETAIPPDVQHEFHQICHSVNEALCYEIGQFATDSMRSVAATLRVDLQVHMGYQNEQDDLSAQVEQDHLEENPRPQHQQEQESASAADPAATNGIKPTIH